MKVYIYNNDNLCTRSVNSWQIRVLFFSSSTLHLTILIPYIYIYYTYICAACLLGVKMPLYKWYFKFKVLLRTLKKSQFRQRSLPESKMAGKKDNGKKKFGLFSILKLWYLVCDKTTLFWERERERERERESCKIMFKSSLSVFNHILKLSGYGNNFVPWNSPRKLWAFVYFIYVRFR